MQDQMTSHAVSVPQARYSRPLYSKPLPLHIPRRTREGRTGARPPEPTALTPAQLRDIIIDQLG